MKLLQERVTTVPGQPGAFPAGPALAAPLNGSVIVQISNGTNRENAYRIAVNSNHPFWQSSWYTLASVGADPNQGNDGKRDWFGPGRQSARIFVGQGQTRNILVRFNLPYRPESRAGLYQFTVLIEVDIPGVAQVRPERKYFGGSLVVKSFYSWRVDALPEERRVGRLRNKTEYNLVVTNQSNDWLYCGLQIPKSKDLVVECPTFRLAVPPAGRENLLPEVSGRDREQGIQRTVPLEATTKLKVLKGDLMPQALSVVAKRLDAPSYPPIAEDPYTIPQSFVLVTETNETKNLAEPSNLVYNPPIPNKPFEIIGRNFSSLKNFVMTLVGVAVFLLIGYHIWLWAQEQQNFGLLTVDLKTSTGHPGARVLASISPSTISVLQLVDKNALTLQLVDSKNNLIETLKWSQDVSNPSRIDITIPSTSPTGQYFVKAEVAHSFLFFKSIPGFPEVLAQNNPELDIDPNSISFPTATVQPGDSLTISGSNFTDQSVVTIGGSPAQVNVTASTLPASLVVQVPPALPKGPYNVVVDGNRADSLLNVGVASVAPDVTAQQVSALIAGNPASTYNAIPANSPTPTASAARAVAALQTGASDADAELQHARQIASTSLDRALIDCAEGLKLQNSNDFLGAKAAFAKATVDDNSLTLSYILYAQALYAQPIVTQYPLPYAEWKKKAFEILVLNSGYTANGSDDSRKAILKEGQSLGITLDEITSGTNADPEPMP